MRLSRRLSAALAAVSVAMAGVVSSAPPASAGITSNGSAAVNSVDNWGRTLIICRMLQDAPSDVPRATATLPVNWKPPLCWLEPQYTGTQLLAFLDSQMGIDPPYVTALETLYGSTSPPYHGNESGWFWGVGCRMDDLNFSSALPAQWAADGLSPDNPWVWIPAGTAVSQPGPVTPTILAEYAAAEVVPPALTFNLNPGALQTVNLSTRIFSTQPAGTFVELEAQAQIGGMTSTVIATPSDVIITPGGPAKDINGNPTTQIKCSIANGSFGSPDNDSCAFYYTKATPAGAAYQLTASINWTYRWVENPNAPGWPVNVTVASNPQNVPVQEVQAIVGGHQ